MKESMKKRLYFYIERERSHARLTCLQLALVSCFWCVSKPNSVTVICTLTRPAVQIPATQYKPRASVQPGYRGAPRKVYLSHLIHPIIQTLGRRRRRRHQRRGTLFDSASTFQSSRYRKRSAWGLYSNKAYMPFSRWGEKMKDVFLCSRIDEPPSLFRENKNQHLRVFSRANALLLPHLWHRFQSHSRGSNALIIARRRRRLTRRLAEEEAD